MRCLPSNGGQRLCSRLVLPYTEHENGEHCAGKCWHSAYQKLDKEWRFLSHAFGATTLQTFSWGTIHIHPCPWRSSPPGLLLLGDASKACELGIPWVAAKSSGFCWFSLLLASTDHWCLRGWKDVWQPVQFSKPSDKESSCTKSSQWKECVTCQISTKFACSKSASSTLAERWVEWCSSWRNMEPAALPLEIPLTHWHCDLRDGRLLLVNLWDTDQLWQSLKHFSLVNKQGSRSQASSENRNCLKLKAKEYLNAKSWKIILGIGQQESTQILCWSSPAQWTAAQVLLQPPGKNIDIL